LYDLIITFLFFFVSKAIKHLYESFLNPKSKSLRYVYLGFLIKLLLLLIEELVCSVAKKG
jgi:hypothetical protein